jgi:hypothetical protein
MAVVQRLERAHEAPAYFRFGRPCKIRQHKGVEARLSETNNKRHCKTCTRFGGCIACSSKTTEVEQKDGKTVAQELTVTTPKGDLPDATPTKVTKNGPLAKWLFSSGGILTIFTGVWGFVQANSNVIAVAILVLGLIIVALIFRGAITDAIRMTAASDPDKNNVT